MNEYELIIVINYNVSVLPLLNRVLLVDIVEVYKCFSVGDQINLLEYVVEYDHMTGGLLPL